MRGLGPMLALELAERSPDQARDVTVAARGQGLLLLSCGIYGNVIRLLMPLVIADVQMDEALNVLEGALKAVYERKHEAAAQPV